MNKDFIPYEQALELKGLGFHGPCFGNYYTLDGKIWKLVDNGQYDLLDELYDIGSKFTISAPTFSQAFRWFREEYGLYHRIEVFKEDNGDIVFDFVIIEDSDDTEEYDNDWYLTYEEAELACLKKLIELSTETK